MAELCKHQKQSRHAIKTQTTQVLGGSGQTDSNHLSDATIDQVHYGQLEHRYHMHRQSLANFLSDDDRCERHDETVLQGSEVLSIIRGE